MKSKRIVLGAVFFVLLAGILAFVWQKNRPQSTAGEKEITVEVVHGDGAEKTFTYQSDLDYLGELLETEGLIAGSESTYGLYVETVDGETADFERDGSWWRLSVDGEDSQTGVDTTPLQSGSVYTWTYTIGS